MGLESLADGFSSGYQMGRQMKKDREEDAFKNDLKGTKTPEQIAAEREAARIKKVNDNMIAQVDAYKAAQQKGIPQVDTPSPTDGMPTTTGSASGLDSAIHPDTGSAADLRSANTVIPTTSPNLPKVTSAFSDQDKVDPNVVADTAPKSNVAVDTGNLSPLPAKTEAKGIATQQGVQRPSFMREDGSFDPIKPSENVKVTPDDQYAAAMARADVLNKHGRYDEAIRLQTAAQQKYTQDHDRQVDQTYLRVKNGDLGAMKELYDTVPDGQTVDAVQNKDGSYTLTTIRESDGKPLLTRNFKDFDAIGDFIQSHKGFNTAMQIQQLRAQQDDRKFNHDQQLKESIRADKSLDLHGQQVAASIQNMKDQLDIAKRHLSLQSAEVGASLAERKQRLDKQKAIDSATAAFNKVSTMDPNSTEFKNAYTNALTALGQLNIPNPKELKIENVKDANGSESLVSINPRNGETKVLYGAGATKADPNDPAGLGAQGKNGLANTETYQPKIAGNVASPTPEQANVQNPAASGIAIPRPKSGIEAFQEKQKNFETAKQTIAQYQAQQAQLIKMFGQGAVNRPDYQRLDNAINNIAYQVQKPELEDVAANPAVGGVFNQYLKPPPDYQKYNREYSHKK